MDATQEANEDSSFPNYTPIVLSPSRNYLQEYLSLTSSRAYHGSSGDFRIVSYNVLADYCLNETPHLYSHCPRQCLDLHRRSHFISAELKLLQPTVLCLQEVDQGFTRYFKTVRNSQWIYKKRTNAKMRDGVAIVFDSEVFELLESAEIEYLSSEIQRLDRANVGLVAVLRSRQVPKNVLIVGNTHLLFNFRRGDIQLSQLIMFISAVRDTLSRYQSQYSTSVVLAGDYNFTPSSPLYKFMVEREIDMSAVPLANLADRNACNTNQIGCGPDVLDRALRRYQYQPKYRYQGDSQLGRELNSLTVEMIHRENGGAVYVPAVYEGPQEHVVRLELPVESAYVTVTGSEGFPWGYIDAVLFTTDYLWHCGAAHPTGVLLPPAYTSLLSAPSLPTEHYPSDHISLVADFSWGLTAAS